MLTTIIVAAIIISAGVIGYALGGLGETINANKRRAEKKPERIIRIGYTDEGFARGELTISDGKTTVTIDEATFNRLVRIGRFRNWLRAHGFGKEGRR